MTSRDSLPIVPVKRLSTKLMFERIRRRETNPTTQQMSEKRQNDRAVLEPDWSYLATFIGLL